MFLPKTLGYQLPEGRLWAGEVRLGALCSVGLAAGTRDTRTPAWKMCWWSKWERLGCPALVGAGGDSHMEKDGECLRLSAARCPCLLWALRGLGSSQAGQLLVLTTAL